jgi:hypothetical protein
MNEIQYEIGREDVPSIDRGEPEKVLIEVVVIHETEDYGTQRVRTASEFRKSTSEDGFNWANSAPVRYIEDSEDPNLSFHTFHVLGIERAVDYVEEHYGPVVNGYPVIVEQ